MPIPSRTPWTFDRSWGDPLIATLLLLSLWLSSQVLTRRQAPALPSSRISLVGIMGEISLLAPQVLRFQGRPLLKPTDWRKASSEFKEPWDRAMVTILATDQGEGALGKELALLAPELAQKAFRCAYEAGPALSSQERVLVYQGLGHTYAGDLLEARLLDREGGDGATARALALRSLSQRVNTLAMLGLLLATAGVGGFFFALRLLFTQPHTLPGLVIWPLEGRTILLVFLAWFSVLLFSGTIASLLVLPLPAGWKILGLPLAYLTHAAFGLFLVLGFSGTEVAEWRRRFFTLSWARLLGWALGFAGLAVVAVFLVGVVLSPLLRQAQPAQKELLETLAAARSLPATLMIFLTVAVLAPAFEEFFFRGFLLPWMAARWGRVWALFVTALLFGAMHLVPGGLPTLSALGLVLGLAYFRTGDLRVCILVHGAWNGSVFLFTRWVLA